MWLHAILAWAYASKGMYSQAITEYEKMGPEKYAVAPENQLIASGSGWVYAIAGNTATNLVRGIKSVKSIWNNRPTPILGGDKGLCEWVLISHQCTGDLGTIFNL